MRWRHLMKPPGSSLRPRRIKAIAALVLALGLVSAGLGAGAAVGTTSFQVRNAPPGFLQDPTTTSTTAGAPQSTINSMTQILSSMDDADEGPLAGVPSDYSWCCHPVVYDVQPPTGYDSATPWGQVYADANYTNHEPRGVQVEIENLAMFVWSNSESQWVEVVESQQVAGAHYVNDYDGNSSAPLHWTTQPDGGVSASMVNGYNIQFWITGTRPTLPIPASDIGAVYTQFQARLIGTGLSSAYFLANAGADWWETPTADYPDNAGVGQGRFVFLTGNWQAFDFWTGGAYSTNPPGWTDAQMEASNPPLDPMGEPSS